MYKMKIFASLLLFWGILLVYAACGTSRVGEDDYTNEYTYEIESHEPDEYIQDTFISEASTILFRQATGTAFARGFLTEVTIDLDRHFFYDMPEAEKLRILQETEIIIRLAQEQLNTSWQRHSFRMYHRPCGSEIRNVSDEGMSYHSLANDTKRTGVLAFLVSSQRVIPVWLSAGLEMYWLETYGMFEYNNVDPTNWYVQVNKNGLPPLGDAWFIPGLIDDPLADAVPSIAHAFVRYLSKMGELSNLINLYQIEETLWDAEYLRAVHWAGFIGSSYVTLSDTVFTYAFGIGRIPGFPAPPTGSAIHAIQLFSHRYEFSVMTRRHWYFFSPSGWAWDYVNHYIQVSKEASAFVSDWLGYKIKNPMLIAYISPHPVYNEITIEFGGGFMMLTGSMGEVFVNTKANSYPWVFVHEYVHAVLHFHPTIERGNFPSAPIWNISNGFEEALCTMLEYMFIAQTANERFALEMAKYILAPLFGADANTDIVQISDRMRYIMDKYNAIDGLGDAQAVMRFIDDNGLFIEIGMNFSAYVATDSRATKAEIISSVNMHALMNLRFNDMDDEYVFGNRYVAIQSYYNTVSFMFYLYNYRGTKDDFMRIYYDIYLMEEVYGTDMDGMIAQWLLYLGRRYGELVEWLDWYVSFFERYEDMLSDYIRRTGSNNMLFTWL